MQTIGPLYLCKDKSLTHQKGGDLVYSNLEPRTSNLEPRTSNLEPRTSNLLLFLISSFAFLNLVGCGGSFNAEITSNETPSSPSSTTSNPCPNNFVSAGPCIVSKAGVAVTEVFGNDITVWSNDLANTSITATIPNAFYANQQVQFADSNLLASNIRSGTSVFGVAGNLTPAHSVCSEDTGTLNVSPCSTSANRYVYTTTKGGRSTDCAGGFNGSACWTDAVNQYVTGALGGNVTTWTNTSSTTTVQGDISLGYYPGSTVAFTDADLLAANIKSGVSIFNVTGSYAGGGVTLMSNMHRDKITTQITQETEAIANSGTSYSNADPGYRAVPRISKDDEGYSGISVTKVSRTNWDTTCDSTTGAGGGSANSVCKCGTSGPIDQRIFDCALHAVIGTSATWDGSTKGNAGQGTWKLVTRTGSVSSGKGREVWRDEQTKLIWSSLVSTALNWCKASGSNNIAGNPVAEPDIFSFCGNAGHTVTYQNNTGQAVSACFEDDGTYFTQAGTDQLGKGGLSSTSSPVVGWRLPTKYDYQLADNNGFRFVVPDFGWEWSATASSMFFEQAWYFNSSVGGYVYIADRTNNHSVRCVGR